MEDPRVNPSADDNYVIFTAQIRGHTEIVKFLLEDERMDLSADDKDLLDSIARRKLINERWRREKNTRT